MNILYMDHYSGSIRHGNAMRPYYLGQEWLKDGHNLTVVGGSFSHVRRVQPDGPGIEDIDGIKYIWVKTPSYTGNDIKRMLSIFFYTFRLLWHMRMLLRESKPDVVVCSTRYMFDMFPSWVMAKIARVPLVFELHDLWPLSPIQLGSISPRHPFILMIRVAEWFTYKTADRIVSCLPHTLKYMDRFGVKEEQFTYCPNGIYLPDWEESEDLPEDMATELKKLKDEGKFLIAYTGAHGIANALHCLLEAADMLRDKNAHFVFIGDGQEKENLQRIANEKGLPNVTFFPKISKRAIPTALRMMDTLFIGLQKKELFHYGISPNKLYDYMMAGRPVLQAIDASNDPVTESGCGLTIEAESSEAIKDGILKLMDTTEKERVEMGKKGHKFASENFDYKVLAKTFLSALQ